VFGVDELTACGAAQVFDVFDEEEVGGGLLG
jgi:Leu/Phe-tRNA-protein transferase